MISVDDSTARDDDTDSQDDSDVINGLFLFVTGPPPPWIEILIPKRRPASCAVNAEPGASHILNF
jgi:hypothetical protein